MLSRILPGLVQEAVLQDLCFVFSIHTSNVSLYVNLIKYRIVNAWNWASVWESKRRKDCQLPVEAQNARGQCCLELEWQGTANEEIVFCCSARYISNLPCASDRRQSTQYSCGRRQSTQYWDRRAECTIFGKIFSTVVSVTAELRVVIQVGY